MPVLQRGIYFLDELNGYVESDSRNEDNENNPLPESLLESFFYPFLIFAGATIGDPTLSFKGFIELISKTETGAIQLQNVKDKTKFWNLVARIEKEFLYAILSFKL